jgi:hypothetical protein
MLLSVACAGASIMPVLARAQIGGGGSVHGTVFDPSGAVVPAATVVATNVATGVKTTRRTTSAGVYVLSPLAAGEYSVTVSAEGFQTLAQEHVIVDALGVVGLNLTLTVGTSREEVTVEATPPPLSTADARLGQTIRNEVYTALPLIMPNGGPRDPTAFMFLQPGVQSIGRWGNVMGGRAPRTT